MSTFDENDPSAALRIGSVLDPESICSDAGILTEGIDMAGYCLSIWTPSGIAEAFASLGTAGARMKLQLDVLEAHDGTGRIALLVVQAGTAQIRLVMPLADEAVQKYLADCSTRGRLRLWLDNDATQKVSIVDLPGGVRAPALLKRLIKEAVGDSCDHRGLLGLGRALHPLNGVRSLIPDAAVDQAMTVLVSQDLKNEIEGGTLAGVTVVRRRLH